MSATLYDLLPKTERGTPDVLLGRFLEYTEARRLTLYPAQEAALLELFEGKNVILNTPTGSGKSLVAAALHFHALAEGRRSVYTCPIKALVNEKWMALCREFGPDNVGLSTGDATVNRDAPILCCTAEVLANIALREGADAPVQDVVMDEFHWYADRDRGVAWQVPLLSLSQARFLLMSATLGDTVFFEGELTRLNGRETLTVRSQDRPVPLEFAYAETPLAETLETLVRDGKAPVYIVHFTQAEAAASAQDFTSLNVCSRDQKAAIARAIEDFRFNSPYGPEIKRWLRHGIGLHHAGLLPKYRVLVEQLAQRGLLMVICGTDTLGVGINVPIRTVLFTRLSKFDGQKVGVLSARDFHQIAGRAGRKGFDDRGWVVAQAPEHVIENLRLEEKSRRDGRKFQRRQAPDRHWVNWDRKTFERLVAAPPERLTSRFQVSHAMLLNVLSREGDGCAAMRQLIRNCHDSPNQKKGHARRAWQLFRSLLDRRIIEFTGAQGSIMAGPSEGAALPEPEPRLQAAPRAVARAKVRVNVELQDDFSMDQTLSLYLLETLPLLDPGAPDYPLDVLTLVESILEDPEIILRRQLDKLKGAKMAEWKQQGMDYLERMEELDKLEYPKPKREFIYSTFNAFADRHPWVGQENIRPKSIAREMFEEFRSFADYVKLYELERFEGLLLRHLNNAYKVLAQTVPDGLKNEALRDMELYFGGLIREVDSSLMEEWARMRGSTTAIRAESTSPQAAAQRELTTETASSSDATRDTESFTAAVRTRIFRFLRALENGDAETALGMVGAAAALVNDGGKTTNGPEAHPSDKDRLTHPRPAGDAVTINSRASMLKSLIDAVTSYRQDHERIRLDPEARNRRHTHRIVSDDRRSWRVQQVLVDPADQNDWMAEFFVDIDASRIAGEPVMTFQSLGPVSEVKDRDQTLPRSLGPE